MSFLIPVKKMFVLYGTFRNVQAKAWFILGCQLETILWIALSKVFDQDFQSIHKRDRDGRSDHRG